LDRLNDNKARGLSGAITALFYLNSINFKVYAPIQPVKADLRHFRTLRLELLGYKPKVS
jgi:hypothetical protein